MFAAKQYGFMRKGEAPNLPSLTIDGALIVGGNTTIGGALDVTGTSTAHGGHVGHARIIADQPNDTAPLLNTAGRAYAWYVGEAQKDLSSIDIMVHLGTPAVAGGGGAALNWAELALATGTLESLANGANTDLTVRGYTSFAAEALIGNTTIEKTVATTAIVAGTGIWAVVASSHQTTQLQFRGPDGIEQTGRSRFAASQPSLNVGVAVAYAANAGALLPTVWIRY